MNRALQPLGDVLRDGKDIALRYQRWLSHPVEKVWRALTESEHLRHWFPADLVGERLEGAELQVRFWPSHVERYSIAEAVLPGRIEVWDPNRVFEWTWHTDRLRFELEPTDEGTLLTFTTWLGEGEAADVTGTAAGYHVCLAQLVELLDTGSAGPLVDVDVSPVEARYADLVG